MRLRINHRSPALPVAAVAAAIVAACSGSVAGGDRLAVVATVYPSEYFATEIGGDRVTARNLVPPGVEAHDFEPGPADVRAMAAADVIVYNGRGFEPWIDRVLGTLSSSDRVTVQTAPEGAGGDLSNDPHVWLDPVQAAAQAERIRDALIAADPAGAAGYRERAAVLTDHLRALDERFASVLPGCRLTRFVTSHDAFGHLAARYGLDALSIAGLSPDAEPGPRDLARLADTMLEHSIKYVLVEPSAATRLSDALAREVGASTLPLHTLETLTPAERERGETYFTLMEANLRTLVTALECPA